VTDMAPMVGLLTRTVVEVSVAVASAGELAEPVPQDLVLLRASIQKRKSSASTKTS
jgi:hypothetical protein